MNSITKKLFFLGGLTVCLIARQEQDVSDMQLQRALVTAQQALNEYQYSAPEQDYQNLLEYVRYYRSWYQAVTPAPIRLVEQLSPAALKFIAQIKYAVSPFTRAPQGIPGSTRLTETGEQFYRTVISMIESQLIDKQMARIMIIPRMQSRLV